MTRSWKMRRVVEAFQRPTKTDPTVTVPYLRLECGHETVDSEAFHYSNERAVQIGRLARAMSGAERRVRCYDCGKSVTA